MNPERILELLKSHQPFDATERRDIARVREFVVNTDRFWSRHTPLGHITASAWIISQDHGATLLTLHRKLGRWLQLGGHIEDDADPVTAARREIEEESGLTDLEMLVPGVFDVDVHGIPARGSEPAHDHYDLRFCFVANATAPLRISSESKALRWFPLEEIAGLAGEDSLQRMAAKILALKR